MPEGDIVWYTARRLRVALAGRVLTRSDFRVPRHATADLSGQTVTEVISRGKHLLIRTDAGLTVHTHLKMEGFWRVTPAGPPPRDHRVRLLLANQEFQAAGYRLGVVDLLRTRDEHRVTGHLGPDLLGPDWDADEAVSRLRRDPGRPVAEALLDQANLAGIGNLYKSEVLFLSGVSPFRAIGDVPDLPEMVERARVLLDTNKDRIDQVTTGNGRAPTWVYGRRGRPCRRCGTRVETETQGERVTFWCPRCQPG
ncbi:MAG: DNA-formamidopyrimidine glycosylase family protein [Streptosporangiaceae bacterium]|jgi:endonuclease VIII